MDVNFKKYVVKQIELKEITHRLTGKNILVYWRTDYVPLNHCKNTKLHMTNCLVLKNVLFMGIGINET